MSTSSSILVNIQGISYRSFMMTIQWACLHWWPFLVSYFDPARLKSLPSCQSNTSQTSKSANYNPSCCPRWKLLCLLISISTFAYGIVISTVNCVVWISNWTQLNRSQNKMITDVRRESKIVWLYQPKLSFATPRTCLSKVSWLKDMVPFIFFETIESQ